MAPKTLPQVNLNISHQVIKFKHPDLMISGATPVETSQKDNDNILGRFSFRNDEVRIQEVEEFEEQDFDIENIYNIQRTAAHTIGTVNYNTSDKNFDSKSSKQKFDRKT